MRKLTALIALPFVALLLASACGGGSSAPTGEKIAFLSCRPDPEDEEYGPRLCDIYTINADGSGQTRLFEDDAEESGGPVWSPDGSRIAVLNRNGDIYV